MAIIAMSRELGSLAQREEFKATAESKRKLQDLTLASMIRADLNARRGTQNVDIDVQVTEGRVTLAGVVDTETEKRAIERAVSRTKGSNRVDSNLHVMGYRGRRIT